MAASVPEHRKAARPAAPRRRNMRADKAPPAWSARLGPKLAVYGALFTVPLAAMLLLAFVWQMNAALQSLSAPPAAASSPAAAQTAADSSRLAFAHLPAPGHNAAKAHSAANAAGQSAKLRAFGDNLRSIHRGLLFSSAAVLAAAAGCFMLLLYFIGRDGRFARSYQRLQTQANQTLEQKLRLRTARLEAARLLAEKERQRAEMLLQDSSHRLGNSLAGVSALLGLQLRQCDDAQSRQALLSARDRVQAISAAHRRLRLNADMETASAGDFLTAVIQDTENSLNAEQRRQIHIETHFEHWHLPARDVTTLGIILGELLTNAIKHAFPNGRKGQIYVAFGKMGAKYLRLIVEDDGIGLPAEALTPPPAAGQNQGLGRLILTQSAAQFNAAPRYARSKNGGCRITIPLLNIKARAAALTAKAAA